MTDRSDRVRLVVEDCAEYWRRTGVPRSTVAGMREELERHLRDAVDEGRSVESVTGPDLLGFAEEWAREFRPAAAIPRPADGRGPAFLALGGGLLAFVTMFAFVGVVSGGSLEVCCPRRVVDAGTSLEPGALIMIGLTLAILAVTLAGVVALFRGRLRLGGGILLAAAALALLSLIHFIPAVMLFAAAAWAFSRARRAEAPVPAP